MKCFRPTIPRNAYFPHSANVYSFNTTVKSHIETAEELLYEAIPCYGERMTATLIETILGKDSKGRWRTLFPTTFDDAAVVLKEGYTFFLTADDEIERKMEIETIIKYTSTHVEVEANEDDTYRQ